MPKHTFVIGDALPKYDNPSDLEGQDIHPLFRREAFRFAYYHNLLSLPELSKSRYDYPEIIYRRMKPALRLATVFLGISFPDMLRISWANVTDAFPEEGMHTSDALSDDWNIDFLSIDYFVDHQLPELCKVYRFTMLTDEHAKKAAGHCESATTNAILNHENGERLLIPQSGLSSRWMWFLSRADFDSMPKEEKYGKLFLLATTLVHEVAHALWLERVTENISRSNIQNAKDGEYPMSNSEPRFTPQFLFGELGHSLEIMLFGGIPSLAHYGTPMDVEAQYADGESYRVPLAIVDPAGLVEELHFVSRSTIFYFFQSDSPLWTFDWAGGELPDLHIELLLNKQRPRRKMSTTITDPPVGNDPSIPIIKLPNPGALAPALTPGNELYFSVHGREFCQRKSRLRTVKLRIMDFVQRRK